MTKINETMTERRLVLRHDGGTWHDRAGRWREMQWLLDRAGDDLTGLVADVSPPPMAGHGWRWRLNTGAGSWQEGTATTSELAQRAAHHACLREYVLMREHATLAWRAEVMAQQLIWREYVRDLRERRPTLARTLGRGVEIEEFSADALCASTYQARVHDLLNSDEVQEFLARDMQQWLGADEPVDLHII
jgi:hypothetical protein